MKIVEVEVVGEPYYLFYNLTAMYEVEEKYGENAMEKMSGDTLEAAQAAFEIFKIMATQGELARRAFGYSEERMPDGLSMTCITPKNILNIKNAIYTAVVIGTERSMPSLEDVDLTLLEIEKKRKVL